VRQVVAVLPLLIVLGAGCGPVSMLDPRGPRSAAIADLWWRLFWIGLGVYLLVMLLLVLALVRQLRRRRAEEPEPPVPVGRLAGLGSNGLVVTGGMLVPAIILALLLVFDLGTLGAIAEPPGPPAVTIDVVGHQYWWEVRYANEGVVTANEIHVPTGRPVLLRLTSADVIHSLWLPQLMGKMDLNPGATTTSWFQADQPGTYLGECAELCGLQHAHMRFQVVADSAADFTSWVQAQQQPATPPTDSDSASGAQTFARVGCISCHTIRYGAESGVGGTIGPDLTHVGSRRTLAAGTLANSLGAMQGWIGNPQAVKPGNNMPVVPLDADALRSLAVYLESLT
jgi:cytochrome c oxidase subunit II